MERSIGQNAFFAKQYRHINTTEKEIRNTPTNEGKMVEYLTYKSTQQEAQSICVLDNHKKRNKKREREKNW